ncbi:hypothetical protein QQ045_001407 [Rhodiola kirilowii]
MRRIYLKAWWRVPCSGRKSLRTESQKDIAEILQSKLTTIIEEDTEGLMLTPFYELTHLRDKECTNSNNSQLPQRRTKVGKYFKSEFGLRELYELVVTGFSTKGSFFPVSGLIRN